MRILVSAIAVVVIVIGALATYSYFSFPPEPIRALSGPPPLLSFTLKQASGLTIDDRGDVLTTRNVVAGCRSLRVSGLGFKAASAEVQALPVRAGLNLALLKIDAQVSNAATFVDVPDPVPQEFAAAETGPFEVVGFGDSVQNADQLQAPASIAVTPRGMVTTPDHTNYIALQGGLPPAMTGGAMVDGKNRVTGVYAGSTAASTAGGTTQTIGGVVVSGEALQFIRSAGLAPSVVDVRDANIQPKERVASATVRVFCFATGFPTFEFYVPQH